MIRAVVLSLVLLVATPRMWPQSVPFGASNPSNTSSPEQFATRSPTGGIQEAIQHAGNGGVVVIPAGNYTVNTPVRMLFQHQTIYAYGAIVTCNVPPSTDCWMIGSPTDANYSRGSTIYGLHLAPGPFSADSSAFCDNAQGTHFYDVGFTKNGNYTFHHGVENDNDQSQVIDHLYDTAGVMTCNAKQCGSALWAPGPAYTHAGITWISDSDLSMGCQGNSIDFESQNHLTVSRSVLQAFSEYALKLINTEVDIDGDTHFERGSCTNPLNDGKGHALGGAGVLNFGPSFVTVEGNLPPAGGGGPTTFTTDSPGTKVYVYYIVAHSRGNSSVPLLIGVIGNGPSSVSGSAYVNTVWPALTNPSATMDLLRVANSTYPAYAPYGTGNYAVATGLTSSICGSNGVCSYRDTVTTPGSYTVPSNVSAVYYPGVSFWPADLGLFPTSDTTNGNLIGNYRGPGLNSGVLVNEAGWHTLQTHVVYAPGSALTTSGLPPVSPGYVVAPSTYQGSSQQPVGYLLPKSNYGASALSWKGVVNFGTFSDFSGPTDLITFHDSNYFKTTSYANLRPPWDAGDSAMCEDNSSGTGLCVRAGSAWSAYIGTVPDGRSWLERLTASSKTLKVPLETGRESNSDNAGQITLNASGAGSYAFTAKYANAPICVVQDITNVAHTFTVSVSTGSLAINSGTPRDVVNYICWGRN